MYLEGFLHKTPMLVIPFCKDPKLTFHPFHPDSPKAITTQDERKQGRKLQNKL
jgi:hypothetical protein